MQKYELYDFFLLFKKIFYKPFLFLKEYCYLCHE